jgi:hypothetical protein
MSQAAIEFEDLQLDEEWRDIPNFPGYQISTKARVRCFKESGIFYHKNTIRSKKNYMNVTSHLNGVTMPLGRLMLLTFVGPPLDGQECDHINRDSLDNRIENLRWVSRSENNLNRKNYGNSKLRGVSILKHVYRKKDGTLSIHTRIRGQITLNGERIKLGDFKTEEEAHEAYKTAYKNHYGYEYQD